MSRPIETRLLDRPDPLQLPETAGEEPGTHVMSLGERAMASIGLFLGLFGLSVLVTTFGPAGTFWCAVVVGWLLRDVDAWIRANGG